MKKTLKLLFTIILLCGAFLIPAIEADSHETSLQWTITYPRHIDYNVNGYPVQAWGDRGKAVIQTSDEGYAIFAQINDHHYAPHTGGVDQYTIELIKTDADGQLQWRKTLPQITACRSVLQTSNGDFIMVGDPSSGLNTGSGASLFKFDGSGNYLWSRNIDFYAFCVTAVNGSGYYLSGMTTNDYHNFSTFAKFDADGTLLWRRTIPNSEWSAAYAVVALPDGGAAIAGTINNAPWISIYDSQGHQQSEKRFPQFSSSGSGSARFTSILNIDGNLVLSGYASENNGGYPISYGLIAKVDYQGNLTMSQTYKNPSNTADQYFGFSSLIATTDGGYAAVAGSVIFKVNSDGTLQWYLTSASDVTNQLGSMDAGAASSDGGFVVTGGKSDSVWLAKFLPPAQASPTPTEVQINQPATPLFDPITTAVILGLVAVVLGLLLYVRRVKSTIAAIKT